MSTLYNQDLISSQDLSKEMILSICDLAQTLKQSPPADALKGKLIGSLFYEPSTRTRLSFEAAIKRLGGDVVGFADASTSSVKKGESLSDTIAVISSYVDAIVLRHPQEGAAKLAAQLSDVPVINAGDGANQHPTQTLLDLFTIRECQGTLEGLNIALVGDLKYGRTIHSLAKVSHHFGMRLFLVSPDSLAMPDDVCQSLRGAGVQFSYHDAIEDVLDKADVVYMTRLQQERVQGADVRQLTDAYHLTIDKLAHVKDNLRILHPLPRQDELSPAVDATPHAYYFQQAANGVYVREALLKMILCDGA